MNDSIDPTTVDWQVESTTDLGTIANMSKGDLGAALIQSRNLNRGLRAQVEGLQEQARKSQHTINTYESMCNELQDWLRNDDDHDYDQLVDYLCTQFDLTLTREWDVYVEAEVRGTATVAITVEAKTEDEARQKVEDSDDKIIDAVNRMSVYELDDWDIERYDVTDVHED